MYTRLLNSERKKLTSSLPKKFPQIVDWIFDHIFIDYFRVTSNKIVSFLFFSVCKRWNSVQAWLSKISQSKIRKIKKKVFFKITSLNFKQKKNETSDLLVLQTLKSTSFLRRCFLNKIYHDEKFQFCRWNDYESWLRQMEVLWKWLWWRKSEANGGRARHNWLEKPLTRLRAQQHEKRKSRRRRQEKVFNKKKVKGNILLSDFVVFTSSHCFKVFQLFFSFRHPVQQLFFAFQSAKCLLWCFSSLVPVIGKRVTRTLLLLPMPVQLCKTCSMNFGPRFSPLSPSKNDCVPLFVVKMGLMKERPAKWTDQEPRQEWLGRQSVHRRLVSWTKKDLVFMENRRQREVYAGTKVIRVGIDLIVYSKYV